VSQIHLQNSASTISSDQLDSSSASRAASPSLTADSDMASRFNMLMNAPYTGAQGEHQAPLPETSGRTQPFFTDSGDSLPLDHPAASQSYAEDAACGKPDASALFQMHGSFGLLFADHIDAIAGGASLSDIDLEMLVERILVSTSDSASQEVRLTLSGDRLAGTEIRIQRDIHGVLTVQFHAHDAAAFQTLVAAQGDLRQILEARISTPVTITVDNGNESGNDTEHRSKGYFQQDGCEA